MKAKEPPRDRRPPRPAREDWRVCRAQYLFEAGRIEQLRAEGLEHFVQRKGVH